jgi:DNA gyrase subunit A
MVSRKGQAIRFHESAARPMGRATEGVRGMSLRKDDEVIAASLAQNDADLLVVTRNGFGKRTRIDEYPVKGRGGLGVQTVKLTEARGELAGALVVRDGYQIMLMSTGGTVIKVPVEDVKRLGRATQGVIVMRMREGEEVSTLAPVVEQADLAVAGEEPPAVAAADAAAVDGEGPTQAEPEAEEAQLVGEPDADE